LLDYLNIRGIKLPVDRELLKEVTKELWSTVKKLRPEVDRETRLQLVLKALITIGDLPNHIEAAMVVGICAEMDQVENTEDSKTNSNENSSIDTSTGRKVVRRSSAK
tara:strand:- start:125 stop:445 length:321 start_codon:yes stop_codon:yes gene_type:complete